MDEQTPHLHVTVVPIVTTEKIKKKGLEQDVAILSSEKRLLDTETQSLEKRKKEFERGNRWIEKTFCRNQSDQ